VFYCALARGEDLSEREALLRLSSASPQARALALQIELARATARTEGLSPNGSVTFSREDAAGIAETYFLYQQSLPITGRRNFLRRAAEAAAESEKMHVDLRLHGLRVELRVAFLEVLHAQEQLKVLRAERGRLEEVVGILRKREQAGESSGYDRLRAERELSLLAAAEGSSEARLKSAQGTLASFFGPPQVAGTLVAVGTLRIPPLPDLDSLIARSLKRGDIQAAEYMVESSTWALEAAHRKLYPEPILTGGLKSPVVTGRRDSGYVLSITVPLPLFDRGKPESARAIVARRAAVSQAEAIREQLRFRVKGAWEETQARLVTAAAYQDHAVTQTEDLVKIARAAYEGGEAGILELLDALRIKLEVQLRLLDLNAASRLAALELERLVGEGVIP